MNSADTSSVAQKTAIITGAAERIGAVITTHLHQAGFNVLVHYRSAEASAKALVDELNQQRAGSALSIKAELTQDGAVEELVSSVMDHWGRLDLVVNNASVFFATPVGQITADNIEKMFGSNVQAPLLLSQAASQHLREANGSIINITDIYAAIVHKDHPVYCASKAALSALTRSLAVELAPDVRVNGISPGAILWPEGDAQIDDNTKQNLLSKIPLDTTGTPEQIAQAVVYLSGENAGYITGQTLSIDGGRGL